MLGPGLVSRRFVVDVRSVQMVKAIVEGYEGVACVFGEQGGALTIAAPEDREAELELLLGDLRRFLATR